MLSYTEVNKKSGPGRMRISRCGSGAGTQHTQTGLKTQTQDEGVILLRSKQKKWAWQNEGRVSGARRWRDAICTGLSGKGSLVSKIQDGVCNPTPVKIWKAGEDFVVGSLCKEDLPLFPCFSTDEFFFATLSPLFLAR